MYWSRGISANYLPEFSCIAIVSIDIVLLHMIPSSCKLKIYSAQLVLVPRGQNTTNAIYVDNY